MLDTSATCHDTFSCLIASLIADNEKSIFDSILRGNLDFSSDPWPSISSSAKDLVKKMLHFDPKERLSAVDVLSKFSHKTNAQ